MADFETFEKIVLSFPEVTVEPHFEKISFRVRKKIIATYDETSNRLTVKLSQRDQDHYASLSDAIYQVDNKWGQQGWTFVELNEVTIPHLTTVLKRAYCTVAPRKLAQQIESNGT